MNNNQQNNQQSAEITLMPGSRKTPHFVLTRALSQVDKIKSIAMIIEYEEGSEPYSHFVEWSSQKNRELAAKQTFFQNEVFKSLNGYTGQ